jgi:hypothetical protein
MNMAALGVSHNAVSMNEGGTCVKPTAADADVGQGILDHDIKFTNVDLARR